MAKLANLRTERHGLRAPTVPQPYPYRAPTPTLTSSLNTDPVPNSGPIPNPDPIPNPNPSRMTLIPALKTLAPTRAPTLSPSPCPPPLTLPAPVARDQARAAGRAQEDVHEPAHGRRGRGGGGAQGRQAGVAQCAPRLVPSTEGEAGSPTARPYVVYTTYYLRITATYALRTTYSLGAVQYSATVLILYLYCTY
jgi:hypothetical protein